MATTHSLQKNSHIIMNCTKKQVLLTILEIKKSPKEILPSLSLIKLLISALLNYSKNKILI